MPRQKPLQAFYAVILLFLCAVFLILTCYKRVIHTYLEDDLLWCLPLIEAINRTEPFLQRFQSFQGGQMCLFDGLYFSAMQTLFGSNFTLYTIVMLMVFLATAGLLFWLLFKRIKVSLLTSAAATILFLTFYGHFHAYIRPISANHLLTVFFILLLFNLYLRTNEVKDEGQPIGWLYGTTLLVALAASLTRLSILIFPAAVLVHLLLAPRDSKDIFRKFAVWVPVLFVISAYPLYTVFLGSGGHTLQHLIGPWQELLEKYSTAVVLGAYLCFWLALLVVFFVLGVVRLLEPLRIFLSALLFLGVGASLSFVLVFWNWITALHSAWNYDPLMRWQMMFYPGGWTFIGLIILSSILYGGFLHYSLTQNKNLTLFVGWFLALLLFLGFEIEPVPSRYLIYVSPVFAVMICVFLFEVMPRFRFFNSDNWRGLAVVLITILGLVNVYAIGVRLNRTLIGDYAWSYDYIKTANVINVDLNRQGKLFSNQGLSVCVKDVTDIPFLEDWRGFLGHGFEPLSPFVKTLQSVLPRGVDVHVNDSCRDDDIVYWMTDRTIVDAQGKNIESFYQYLESGLQAWRSEDLSGAREDFKRATENPPFAIQFLVGSKQVNPSKLSYAAPLLLASWSKYSEDEKLNTIANMIQRESADYGLALALLSFLEKESGATVDSARRKLIADFISPEEFKEYSVAAYFPESTRPEFVKFLETLPPSPRTVLGQKVEEYKDYNIYRWQGGYFGLRREEGPLELAKFKKGGYQSVRKAGNKHELRTLIDTEVGGPPQSYEELYQEFKITRDSERYISEIPGQPATQFYAQNPKEAKITIDSFSKTPTLEVPPRDLHYPDRYFGEDVAYKVTLFNAPLGEIFFKAGRAEKVQSSAQLKPWPFLQKLSQGTLVLNMAATSNPDNFLPEEFAKITLYRMNKGKGPHKIIYHHDQLFMERKEKREDILSDTRDPLSLILWLGHQDYENRALFKSTLNIDRRLYVVTAKVVKKVGPIVDLNVEVTGIDNNYDKVSHYPLAVRLYKTADGHLPVWLKLQLGIFPFQVQCRPKS